MKKYITKFSDSEYARRHQHVRQEMEKRGIDVLIVPTSESLLYLTGVTFQFFGFYLLFPREGEPTIFSDTICYRDKHDRENNGPIPPDSRYGAGENSIHIEDTSYVRQFIGASFPELPGLMVKWITDRGYANGTIGCVGREIDWGGFQGGSLLGVTGVDGLNAMFRGYLLENLAKANFVNATDVLAVVRRVKSAEEVSSMRKAAGVADDIAEGIREEMLKPGVMEKDMWAVFWDRLYRSGGGNGYFFMAFTEDTGNPYDFGARYFPYNRKIEDGDIFVAEIVPEWIDGYTSHIDVSFVKGQPKLKELYDRVNDACLGCYDAVVNALKPGAVGEEIVKAGDDVLREYDMLRAAPLAYSIGVYCFEPPLMGLTSDPWHESIPLQPNMIINVISHVYDPKTMACVRTGSTHLINDGGQECLNNTSFPRGMVCV